MKKLIFLLLFIPILSYSQNQSVDIPLPANITALGGISGSGTSGNLVSFTGAQTVGNATLTITGGTGITTSGSLTSFTVTNSSPSTSLVAGTNITLSGTAPTYTVAQTAQTTIIGGNNITITGTTPTYTVSQTNSATVIAGSGISVNGTFPTYTVSESIPIKMAQTTITSAQMLAITSNTVTLVAANGLTHAVLSIAVTLNYVSTTYAAGANIAVKYFNGTSAGANIAALSVNDTKWGANSQFYAPLVTSPTSSTGIANGVNSSIIITCPTNYTTGDGSLTIRVYYTDF